MILWMSIAGFLICAGIVEYVLHRRNLAHIPIRVHVNGTRGKSTTTRCIAAGLREAGLRVIAKTTGSAARLILEDGHEEPLTRRGTPNIIEQKKIIALARKRKADAVVIECMAIAPENQWVAEHRLIRSTIGVITNVRYDHTDQMGATLTDIIQSLAQTIPRQGQLVTSDRHALPHFKTIGDRLSTSVSFADAAEIPGTLLNTFPYPMFPDNLACALYVCELLGISRSVALQGMHQAAPDPGATRIFKLTLPGRTVYLINAFAANDPDSTRLVWEAVQQAPVYQEMRDIPLIGVLNHRGDRQFRVKDLAGLAHDVLPMQAIVLLGQLRFLTTYYLRQAGIPPSNIRSVSFSAPPDELFKEITRLIPGDVALFGFGNIKGPGQRLIEYAQRYGELLT